MYGLADGDLAGQDLPQIDGVELAEAAGGDDLRRGAGRDVVRVARERRAAGAGRAKQDLVLLERRRLEHDLHAVGQLPLGDADGVLRRGAGDRRRARAAARAASPRPTVSTYGCQLLRRRRLHHGRQLRLVGQRPARSSPAR